MILIRDVKNVKLTISRLKPGILRAQKKGEATIPEGDISF